MPYRPFLAWNATGGILWGAVVVTGGYLAGESYHRVEAAVGRDGALVVAGLGVVAFVIWRIRQHRTDIEHDSDNP